MIRSPQITISLSNSKMLVISLLLISLFTLSNFGSSFGTETRPLMRFPDIHENTIVFVYGEDIWSVAAEGGVATRLTVHDGAERFPKFSPDGKLIAFTGWKKDCL